MKCPCGSGQKYAECCEPFHQQVDYPETAKQLMCSRYSAYVLKMADYLLQSWDESTRPPTLSFDDNINWLKLRIIKTKKGGSGDKQGMVLFKATFEADNEKSVMTEKSQFRRNARNHWVYLKGDVS